jgi:hypothetical protein
VCILSAEKEIVNFWLNKKGFFTINNIKSANRDLGIIALKDKQLLHYEILCSITSSQKDSVGGLIQEKFSNKSIQKIIKRHLDQFNLKETKKFIVLSNISNKNIIKKFNEKNIEVLEFENILADVIKDLDTQYYKNDVIRSLQLLKYLFLTNSKNVSNILVNETLSPNERKEFMKELLDKEEIVKEFRKTNEERLAEILKHSTIKNPEKLAELLENKVLNRRTRKPFLSSLLEQRKIKKIYKQEFSKKKKETPLNKFF